jgi:8-oxo-dGTP diphosphatase
MSECAGALLIRNGKVLLVRRALHKSFPGLWDVPGGHCEPGETPKAALIRELEEELGIITVLTESTLACRTTFRMPGLTLHIFAIREWSGEPVMLGDEHTDMQWFSFAEAAALTGLVAEEYRELFAVLT